MRRAFTLIELLIVVAIIAILAAIAVPNFLEAQTRSKVTRAKADLRTYATAIESYTVDYNKPPGEYNTAAPQNDPPIKPGQSATGIIALALSTPVAYLSSAWLYDPFVQRGDSLNEDQKIMSYHNHLLRDANRPLGAQPNWSDPIRAQILIGHYGAWRVGSIGPDRDFYNNLRTPGSYYTFPQESIAYDPSNGTISEGNIWRGAGNPEGSQPPVGPALAAH